MFHAFHLILTNRFCQQERCNSCNYASGCYFKSSFQERLPGHDAELKREHNEIEEVPLTELKEVEDIFSKIGGG